MNTYVPGPVEARELIHANFFDVHAPKNCTRCTKMPVHACLNQNVLCCETRQIHFGPQNSAKKRDDSR